MSRYINAAELFDMVYEDVRACSEEGQEVKDKILQIIADFETADVQEVIHARWEEDETSGFLCCSNCGSREPYFKAYKGSLFDDSDPEKVTYYACPFCNMCGAWMEND